MTHPISTSNPSSSTVQTETDQQKALADVIARIRESLDLDTIFKTTVTEVRQWLKVDRVAIFRFYPEQNWEGEFVSEDVAAPWVSAMQHRVQDHRFSERFAPLYQQGQIHAIADIHAGQYQDCYLKILEQFQVRANVVAPLLKGETLWGLLCIHDCQQARNWEDSEVEFVGQIAQHLGTAITQAEHLTQVQAQAIRLASAAERERALAKTIDVIRRSLDPDTIFQTATEEARKLLQVERVAIYQFLPDWSGLFVAESLLDGWKPLVDSSPMVADTFLQETGGGRYVHNETCAIADIYQAGLKDCHIQLLEQFQAKAFAIAPILVGERLWGLIAAYHNTSPRDWQPLEVDWLAQIGTQMGVALQHAEYFKQVQIQSALLAQVAVQEKAVERQRAITASIVRIRQSLDLETIFQTSVYEVQQLLNADRVVIYQFNPDWSGRFVAESMAPEWDSLVHPLTSSSHLRDNVSDCSLQQLATPPIVDSHLQDTKGGRFSRGERVRVCHDVDQAGFSDCYRQVLKTYQARAYAIAGIYHDQHLWGLLAAFQNSEPRRWQSDEVQLLTQISSQLGVALQQAEYVKRVEKTAERQRSLFKTIDKIRQSLDLDFIFQTTTQEVRQFLEVDRVAIYRFYKDWSGEFVADSISDGWTPTITPQISVADIFLPNTQVGQYSRHEVFVPILQGEALWGLLVAYQMSEPRRWATDEKNLLTQIGVQLGIALQQAELLEQTRQQATELAQALAELKDSQLRLIQGEKMASLGQLVAGVAHEINNPVNFISGNLGHLDEYFQTILELIDLYQKHVPNPSIEIQDLIDDFDLDFVRQDSLKLLRSMQSGAERICEIVLSLRNFSRLDEAQRKFVNIHDGIDSTLLILQHRLNSTSARPAIQIIKQYGELPLVECYPAQLNQVIMNILSNGIDALEESITARNNITPTIQIRTTVVNTSRISIRIKDNGIGLLDRVRSRIFDPFFTTKPVGKGTGLGLSISYQIITEGHNGDLKCASQPNRGTEFAIEIPIRQSQMLRTRTETA
ncbi:MAG: GAF domain-containing protein [Myxacorys chilensis ATA2-1-KO14]|jgi:GAF domain-containing protein|nr:GAF domain-containing protein [Myxacorys chilensis ATA2-1-KO14]